MSAKKQAISSKTNGDKSVNKSKTDRISELPDQLLSSIVSDFTVRDAVNRSLLSSRWRNLLLSMPDLNFDFNTMFQRPIDFNQRNRSDIFREYEGKFIVGVNQFLKCYKATHVVSFRVAYSLDIANSTDDIDEWINFAFSKGVKKLELSLPCTKCLEKYHCRCKDNSNLYIFHPKRISLGNASKLEQLKLHSCLLGQGVINHFNCLKTLTIFGSRLGPDEIESLLSCCLNLTFLKLGCCILPPKLRISSSSSSSSSSSHKLKDLHIITCCEVEEIELSATNLTVFEYFGCMIRLSFSSVPNLKRIFVRTCNEELVQHVFSKLAIDVPLVETLLLFSAIDWVQWIPKPITTFNKVKRLEICSASIFDSVKILSILKACPVVEMFRWVVNPLTVFEYDQGIQGLPIRLESVHKFLKEVHIGGFFFTKRHIEFARYMLDYADALNVMIIEPYLKCCIGEDRYGRFCSLRETWFEGELVKIRSQLKDHSKSSMIIVRESECVEVSDSKLIGNMWRDVSRPLIPRIGEKQVLS